MKKSISFCQILKEKHTHTQTRLMALCPGLPRWAGARKVKPIWILLEQETVSGTGIIWAICKSATRSRQITMPVTHHSVFYRPDALPATQPTASKHWRHYKKREAHTMKIGSFFLPHSVVLIKCNKTSSSVAREVTTTHTPIAVVWRPTSTPVLVTVSVSLFVSITLFPLPLAITVSSHVALFRIAPPARTSINTTQSLFLLLKNCT